jgi:hypothetical protein
MRWKETVHIKVLIEQYDDDAIDELEEIKRIKPFWIERFNKIDKFKQFVPAIKKLKTETQFNKFLNNVYDYCDCNNIWVDY